MFFEKIKTLLANSPLVVGRRTTKRYKRHKKITQRKRREERGDRYGRSFVCTFVVGASLVGLDYVVTVCGHAHETCPMFPGTAPAGMIGASNFFELSVAVAIALFGTTSPVALATIVGVLVEVPVIAQ